MGFKPQDKYTINKVHRNGVLNKTLSDLKQIKKQLDAMNGRFPEFVEFSYDISKGIIAGASYGYGNYWSRLQKISEVQKERKRGGK